MSQHHSQHATTSKLNENPAIKRKTRAKVNVKPGGAMAAFLATVARVKTHFAAHPLPPANAKVEEKAKRKKKRQPKQVPATRSQRPMRTCRLRNRPIYNASANRRLVKTATPTATDNNQDHNNRFGIDAAKQLQGVNLQTTIEDLSETIAKKAKFIRRTLTSKRASRACPTPGYVSCDSQMPPKPKPPRPPPSIVMNADSVFARAKPGTLLPRSKWIYKTPARRSLTTSAPLHEVTNDQRQEDTDGNALGHITTLYVRDENIPEEMREQVGLSTEPVPAPIFNSFLYKNRRNKCRYISLCPGATSRLQPSASADEIDVGPPFPIPLRTYSKRKPHPWMSDASKPPKQPKLI